MRPIVFCSWFLGHGLFLASSLPAAEPIEFNRDIRPLLSDACFHCHGPENAKRKADLRFDTHEGATADLGGHRAIVPGKAGESEMLKRLIAPDGKGRMPPPSAGPRLTAQQIDLLRRWIEQGAKYQKHWALIAPQRAELPTVKNRAWPRNPLDYFIQSRLEKEGFNPAPEADRATLIRRLSLDLTGLPPIPAEVDAFLADRSPDAYEHLVDRLLASPRYGERLAFRWLEAARYADTNGYQTDGPRTMWRWRDWVIDAFNANQPFDRFTVEQLAGDMLPNRTLDQHIASGFNRNHRGNSEGGVIPEEYAVEYVVDRVDTTYTVWLGLTMGCARCHDHKYDPLSQKEFYQSFAYFNNVPEKGKAIKYGNSMPYIKAPTKKQEKEWQALKTAAKKARDDYHTLYEASSPSSWQRAAPSQAKPWMYSRGLVAHFPLDGSVVDSRHPETVHAADGQAFAPGRMGQGALFDGTKSLDLGDIADFGFFDKFTFATWVFPIGHEGGTIFSRMADTDRADGYQVLLEKGRIHVNLVKRWLDDAIRIEYKPLLEPNQWHFIAVMYDGSRLASGVKVYIDDPKRLAETRKIHLDDLNQSFQTKQPLRIGGGGGRVFHGLIDEVQIFNRDLQLDFREPLVLATPESIETLLAIPRNLRSWSQRFKIDTYFLETKTPINKAFDRYLTSKEQLRQFGEALPTVMVMSEMDPPRDTHLLLRGEYDKKGPKVSPALPASFPALSQGVPNNRLGFAQWLVQPEHPLTSRVAVNRFWQMLFGNGLVRTLEDFGSQGDWPSHPELLDWLAVEFMENGWDVKALLKQIVTSATYRQSSKVTPLLLQKDPDNRLLARGPRVRLSAEMVRDQALAAAGLLVEHQGGPSVKPYQPAGLGKELNGADEDEQDHGADLYRRSLYTYWKRTVAPPGLMTFDAANRETCVVRQSRTNTPLQALNLMNDVTFVEAARVLAQKVLHEAEPTANDRLNLLFRKALSRSPRPAELQVLRAGLENHQAFFQKNRPAALKLVTAGEFPRDEQQDVAELAAYTAVASLILNLDEVITRE